MRREDALCRGESMDVIRSRVEANEDQRFVLAACGRDVGVEDNRSDSRADANQSIVETGSPGS